MTFSAHYPELQPAGDDRQSLRRGPDAAGNGGLSKPPDAMLPDCMTEPAAEQIPPAASPRGARSTPRLILNLLATVTSAPALLPHTGVTRQRVDQILRGLMREGKVKRVLEPGWGRRYLWFRADVDIAAALRLHRKPLVRGVVGVLSCLAADCVHSTAQIAEYLKIPYYAAAARLSELTKLGLVTRITAVRPGLISITPSGLAHPDRNVAAGKTPALDVVHSLGERRAEIIEALSVFGTARSIDLTAASRTKVRGRHWSGQLLHVMWVTGLVERFECIPGKQPRIRLTDTGRQIAACIARMRPPPLLEHLESNISAYNAGRTPSGKEGLRKRMLAAVPGAPAGAQSLAQARILRALEAGPLRTTELRPSIADLGQHPRSLTNLLTTLAARGAVHGVGGRGFRKLWMLPNCEADRTIPSCDRGLPEIGA